MNISISLRSHLSLAMGDQMSLTKENSMSSILRKDYKESEGKLRSYLKKLRQE